MVRVDVATGAGDTGVESEQVAPDGQPVTVRLTLPLNPFMAVTVTVEVPGAPPWVTVTLAGEAETLKFGAGSDGHPFTRLAAFSVPIPVAKSQPVVVPKAGA